MTEIAGTAAAQRGPIGETRSVGLSILWFILTLGIYGIYWVYKTQEEVKRYSGNGVGGVIGLVIYILIAPVTFFVVPSEVRFMYEDLDGSHSPVRGTTGLWFLLPLVGHIVWFVKVQRALNNYWVSKGAQPK
jgi:amino acid transporter